MERYCVFCLSLTVDSSIKHSKTLIKESAAMIGTLTFLNLFRCMIILTIRFLQFYPLQSIVAKFIHNKWDSILVSWKMDKSAQSCSDNLPQKRWFCPCMAYFLCGTYKKYFLMMSLFIYFCRIKDNRVWCCFGPYAMD